MKIIWFTFDSSKKFIKQGAAFKLREKHAIGQKNYILISSVKLFKLFVDQLLHQF